MVLGFHYKKDSEREINLNSKVVIIGAGNVGTSIGYVLMIKGLARYISFIDLDESKVTGEVLDLNHGKPFVKPVRVMKSQYSLYRVY